jgi:hypothetical protein
LQPDALSIGDLNDITPNCQTHPDFFTERSEVTYYVALPFVMADDGVAPGEAVECLSANAAVMRAEALSRKPGCAGALAFSRTGDRLVFVRLAHDRRLVGAVLFVLFLFVLVLSVFIRISGRHRVAHDHEGTPVDQLGGKFFGDVWRHGVRPRVWTLEVFTPFSLQLGR